MTPRQQMFISALAEFLASNEVEMSIGLQLGKVESKRWAKLRNASPLMGYYPEPDGMERAKAELTEFLGLGG